MSEAKPAKTWAGSKSLHRNERKIETGAIDSHVSPCLGVCSVVNEVSSREEPSNGSPQNAHNSSENAPGNTRMKTYHLVGFVEDFVANHQRPHGLQITPRAVQHREIGRLSRISQSPCSRDHERFARRMVTATAVASTQQPVASNSNMQIVERWRDWFCQATCGALRPQARRGSNR